MLEKDTMSTLVPSFLSLQKATWEMQTSIAKRNTVISQGGLLGVRTGVQSVHIYSVDAKNSKSLPICL